MNITYPMPNGKYIIQWENSITFSEKTSCLELTNIRNEYELQRFLEDNLEKYDKLIGDNPIILYECAIHEKRQIAIIDFEDEFGINELLDKGYSIREFHNNKCILQKKNTYKIN